MRKTILSLTPLLLLFFFLSCQKERSFELSAPGMGALQDASGDCSPKLVGGTYIAGKALTDSNFIDVGVYVVKKGSYTISAPAQNGFSFKGTGTFADTGLVMVRLRATGTPVAAGNNDFTVTYDSLSCNVSITVLPAGSTGGGGGTSTNTYFPLAQNSTWSYDDPTGSGDTSKTVVSGTASFISKSYTRFINTYSSGGDDTGYYRKDAATNYFWQYADLDDYTGGAVTFTGGSKVEVNFLRETLTTGTTWNNDFAGTTPSIPGTLTLRFKYTCTNAAATATYNGKSFGNVYIVRLELQLGVAGMYQTQGQADFYYAKGVGLINIKGYDMTTTPPTVDEEYQIRQYTIQ
jgi:hypothetical protein